MRGPAKHRLHDYEAGWLTLLLAMRVASRRDLEAAQARVARQAIERMERRQQRRRADRRRDEEP